MTAAELRKQQEAEKAAIQEQLKEKNLAAKREVWHGTHDITFMPEDAGNRPSSGAARQLRICFSGSKISILCETGNV